jgi:hypothetical protein
MLADGGAPGAAAVTVLCDIDFLAGRKGRNAKAGTASSQRNSRSLPGGQARAPTERLVIRPVVIASTLATPLTGVLGIGKRNYDNSSAREKSREISIAGNQKLVIKGITSIAAKAGKARKYATVKYTI